MDFVFTFDPGWSEGEQWHTDRKLTQTLLITRLSFTTVQTTVGIWPVLKWWALIIVWLMTKQRRNQWLYYSVVAAVHCIKGQFTYIIVEFFYSDTGNNQTSWVQSGRTSHTLLTDSVTLQLLLFFFLLLVNYQSSASITFHVLTLYCVQKLWVQS